MGEIVGQGLAPAETDLSQYGKIARDQLLDLENRYKSVKIDKYVIKSQKPASVLDILKSQIKKTRRT